MWAVIDIILRTIKNTSIYFGGVLLISSMDPEQLKPIQGRPFLISPFVLTSFSVSFLDNSVRAISDSMLQKLNMIARKPNQTDDELDEFEYIIKNHCNHVNNWESNQIRPDMLRFFGKKKATEAAEKIFFQNIKDNRDITHLVRKSEEIQTLVSSHGNWVESSQTKKNKLNRNVKEPREIVVYKNAIVQVTYNSVGKWSQSQMGVICDLTT